MRNAFFTSDLSHHRFSPTIKRRLSTQLQPAISNPTIIIDPSSVASSNNNFRTISYLSNQDKKSRSFNRYQGGARTLGTMSSTLQRDEFDGELRVRTALGMRKTTKFDTP
jgi:hypothetical protein